MDSDLVGCSITVSVCPLAPFPFFLWILVTGSLAIDSRTSSSYFDVNELAGSSQNILFSKIRLRLIVSASEVSLPYFT